MTRWPRPSWRTAAGASCTGRLRTPSRVGTGSGAGRAGPVIRTDPAGVSGRGLFVGGPAHPAFRRFGSAGKGRTTVLYFYHGTSLEQAKKLMTIDLGPMAVPAARALDWREYTDFGKGFYVHPEEN